MHKWRWLNLQLFADGGEGGEGAASTGESAQAAAETATSRLKALGVPQDKIEKFEKRANRALPPRSVEAGQKAAKAATPQAAAATQEVPENQPQKKTFAQILEDADYKAEYDKEMQKTVQMRLRTERSKNKERNDKLTPIFTHLGAKYGIDTTDLDAVDLDALAKAMSEDHSYYDRQAEQMGVTSDTAKYISELEADRKRAERQRQIAAQQQMANEHFQKLYREAEVLKKTFPDFDLNYELQNNEEFIKRTSPVSGMSVKDAFFSLYGERLLAEQAANVTKNVTAKIANAVQSGKNRPVENGASQQTAPVVRDMRSKEYRDFIKRQANAAMLRGEKYYLPE